MVFMWIINFLVLSLEERVVSVFYEYFCLVFQFILDGKHHIQSGKLLFISKVLSSCFLLIEPIKLRRTGV